MEIRWENLIITLAITLVVALITAYRQYVNGASFLPTFVKAWFGYTAVAIVILGFFG